MVAEPDPMEGRTVFFSGDARPICLNGTIEPNSVQCIVTSPPYFRARKYDAPNLVYGEHLSTACDHMFLTKGFRLESGYCACGAWKGQLGDEQFPVEYVLHLREVLRATIPVLKPDGTLWLNLGDCRTGSGYSNHKNTGGATRAQGGRQRHAYVRGYPTKMLLGMPWRVALAMQDDGWLLRSAIVWHKGNPQPESVKDRPKMAHEFVFLFARQQRYFFADHWREWAEATGDVWQIPVQQFHGAHYATMPEELAKRCIMLGSAPGDIVLDPFGGVGTTALVARRMNRQAVSIDVSEAYTDLAVQRVRNAGS